MVNENEGVLCAAPRLGVTERESSGGPARSTSPLEVLLGSACRMSKGYISSEETAYLSRGLVAFL